MKFFDHHTHASRKSRSARKKMGQWKSSFATALWDMRGGKQIKLRDMGDGHLINTIRLLIRFACKKRVTETVRMVSLLKDMDYPPSDEMTFEDFVPDVFQLMLEEYGVRGGDDADFDEYVNHFEALADKQIVDTLLARAFPGRNLNVEIQRGDVSTADLDGQSQRVHDLLNKW